MLILGTMDDEVSIMKLLSCTERLIENLQNASITKSH